MRTFSICLSVIAMIATGCGSEGASPTAPSNPSPPANPSPPSNPAPTLARLELSAPDTLLVALGETTQVEAKGFDSEGSPVTASSIVWSSSAPTIAWVSNSGQVTAAANGSVSITARSGTVSATLGVRIEQLPARVSLSGAPTLIKAIGAEFDLAAVVLDRNDAPIVAAPVAWTTSAASVVDVTDAGHILTTGVGKATVTASSSSVSEPFELEVVTERRLTVDPYLATPAAGAVWEVPVVIVAYIPTADGVNIDVRKNPDFWILGELSLDTVEQRVLDFSKRRKMMIEEGSRYHGYRDPTARPSIGYRVVEYIIVYDLSPPSSRSRTDLAGNPRFTDFFKVFSDLGLVDLITSRGVREVWFSDSPFDAGFPSYDPAIHKTEDMRFNFESNMASPTTGDISNSFRWNDDLPILGHTYVVYGINFRRSQAEAVHNVGHQLEAQLSHVAFLQDGSTDLFWKQFVGQNGGGEFITGRAGWTHMPPNTTGHYDYLNPTLVAADIENWRPDGSGMQKAVNVDTWGTLTYPWPGAAEFSQRVESQWYIYWMQNHPGFDNGIPHASGTMTNWWAFLGDWDAAIGAGLGLYEGSPSASVRTGTYASQLGAPSTGRWPVHIGSSKPRR